MSPLRRGFFCFGNGRQTLEDVKREQLARRGTFLEKGSPSPRSFLPKTFAAGPAGMSALVFRATGGIPFCFPQTARDARFYYRISKPCSQPVNEPASSEASGSRHVFRWTDADPGSFPGYARLKKAVVTAVTAASGRLTRDSCKSRHGCALGSRPFAP